VFDRPIRLSKRQEIGCQKPYSLTTRSKTTRSNASRTQIGLNYFFGCKIQRKPNSQ
jgi:hypothetical protein